MRRYATGDIAITGYNGFLGSLLVPALQNELGVTPILIDKARIPSIRAAVVIHLGEPSSLARCEISVVESCNRNIQSIVSNPSVHKVVYVSSALLYNRNHTYDGGWVETSETLADDNYKLIKSNSERCLVASGKSFTALRLSNVLGYSSSKANLLSDIFRQINNESKLVELRDLAPVNDFICAYDAVAAVLHCLVKGCSGIFNCGSGVGLSVSELCEQIFSSLGRRDLMAVANRTTHRDDVNNQNYFALNISKLKTTGWSPSVSLGDCVVGEWEKFVEDAGI